MRILRLSLENWRGVTSRSIEFCEGVTVIEGPNEIGKSSIIEALQMLIHELDSSKKKSVKAVQPVDRDVGSTVAAEIEAGDYRFVYAKTYNRSPQTTLDVLTPQRRQLTGREAHEAVEQMLAETVDMALWQALLVDQGDKVGLADLQNSAGLAQALDAAAGNAGAADAGEDNSLIAAVQAEYERYYTAKTGRSKYQHLEEAAANADASLAAARAALTEIEENTERHRVQTAEVRRLKAALPELEKRFKAHETTWQSVRSLTEKLTDSRKALDSARTIQKDAERAVQERQRLIDEVEKNEKQLESERLRQAPLAARTQELQTGLSAAQLQATGAKTTLRALRAALDLMQRDAAYLENLDELAAVRKRLTLLTDITAQLSIQLRVRSEISIDAAGLDQLRDATSALAVARGKRDAASTTLSVTALRDLDVGIAEENLSLRTSQTTTRGVSSSLEIHLPEIARIRVTPSRSVAELAEETAAAEALLETLQQGFGVDSLEAAVVANQRRTEAERTIESLKARERELLQSATTEELALLAESLETRCTRYAQERSAATPLPENATAAANLLTDAKARLAVAENDLEEAQREAERLAAEHAKQDGALRMSQQELAVLERLLGDNRATLDRAREERTDATLQEREQQTTEAAAVLAKQMAELESTLTEISPEAARTLFENARDVLDGARAETVRAERDLAVLTDRLEQARANGRFEEAELATRRCEAAHAAFATTRQRAEAAQRLWVTLSHHREAARESYVRPLKAAIERLGAVVFGSGFSVGLGDDWSIVSRTHQGKTLEFEDLSIGAKEQLGILTRLAAAQIVSKQGGVPLVLDDALGFSDPLRLETMGAAIAAAGRQCQIIILTCTPGRFTHVGNARVIRID
ncbi:MAG: AAA family ATPase [Pseudomonadales bacterium]|nr:AAA family ATPase [Pseudomonadales bacterium]